MSIYTQEAVAAEVNYRLELAQSNSRHVAEVESVERPSWLRRLFAGSETRRQVVRATPATQ